MGQNEKTRIQNPLLVVYGIKMSPTHGLDLRQNSSDSPISIARVLGEQIHLI